MKLQHHYNAVVMVLGGGFDQRWPIAQKSPCDADTVPEIIFGGE